MRTSGSRRVFPAGKPTGGASTSFGASRMRSNPIRREEPTIGRSNKAAARPARFRLKSGGIDTFNVSIPDRKSTRLNSSHLVISYAVFCLKKKKKKKEV